MNWSKIVSGLVAGIYLAVAYAHGGLESSFKISLFLILPLACIWFARAMGQYSGPSGIINITASTPGLIIFILGWSLLLLPLIIVILFT